MKTIKGADWTKVEKEFNLSKKWALAMKLSDERKVYLEEYVKEFIKRDNKIIHDFIIGRIDEIEMWKRKWKLAGDKLV